MQDLDNRVDALERQFDKLGELLDRLLTVVEGQEARLQRIEKPKVEVLKSGGMPRRVVSKEPGDREKA